MGSGMFLVYPARPEAPRQDRASLPLAVGRRRLQTLMACPRSILESVRQVLFSSAPQFPSCNWKQCAHPVLRPGCDRRMVRNRTCVCSWPGVGEVGVAMVSCFRMLCLTQSHRFSENSEPQKSFAPKSASFLCHPNMSEIQEAFLFLLWLPVSSVLDFGNFLVEIFVILIS